MLYTGLITFFYLNLGHQKIQQVFSLGKGNRSKKKLLGLHQYKEASGQQKKVIKLKENLLEWRRCLQTTYPIRS